MAVQLHTIASAQEVLGCSENHVYRLIAAGQLRAVDIRVKGSKASKTRVRDDDLQTYIEENTRSAATLRAVAGQGGGRGEVRRIDGS